MKHRELSAIAASAVLRPLIESDGAVPIALEPDAIAERLRDEYAQWQRVAVARHLRVE